MAFKIGIDVGGTFTDFFLVRDGADPLVHKVLSTPEDPSIAVLQGLSDLAGLVEPALSLADFCGAIVTIVHGTTVTTNAILTRTGAKSGLITTAGVRDALEMRRGIREQQYNNRFTNVAPLVPRYLRIGVAGRLDRAGREVTPLDLAAVGDAVALFKAEGVGAVSICFMNAFANSAHEQAAAAVVREAFGEAYLTVSSELLPSIRFYDRVSTTALSSYVGPKLDHYLNQLSDKLAAAGFAGALLIMQSNGGVMTPEVARRAAALTLLSGPAGGPGAGLFYARAHDLDQCIVVDMGGTSFEASMVVGEPVMITEGEIDRLRIALPMLGIHTIGAGGGSICRIDEGGMVRVGPESAGADPGPVCYGRGGTEPTTTDANLVLGYLDADFFAGGSIRLDTAAARAAIDSQIAKPLGLSIEAAAAGVYRIACTNMAQGVREITIKRGSDPREFPMIVAGGAGPLHSCLICDELEIPLQIVPRESSILCAVGMLMGDLRHDFVRTFVTNLSRLDWPALEALLQAMQAEGEALLDEEGIPPAKRRHVVHLDCRYQKQYHEVSFAMPAAALAARDTAAIAEHFHDEHNRLYGYALADEDIPVEIINVRLQSLGATDKPDLAGSAPAGADASAAIKGERQAYVFEDQAFRLIPVFDGHKLSHGNRLRGPAIIEQVTTAILVSKSFDCVVDRLGSFVLYRRGREDLVATTLQGDGA